MELTFRTMVVLFYKLLFLSQILKCGYCFMPTRSSAILESDFTMEDIIRTGLSDLTSEYFGAEDGESREEAISGIVQACNMVGYTQRDNPIWSFSDEKISEGHDLLVSLRDRIVQQLSQLTPDYSAARETLGQIYYPLLKFYSNTNWVELGDKGIYKSLGVPGRPIFPVAPINIDMCIACGELVKQSCRNNLLTDKFLTSGYFGQTQRVNNTPGDNDVQMYGKCRFGGVIDRASASGAVPGGINKLSENLEYSPHYFLHKYAATLAIEHTRFYLFDKDYGLCNIFGHEKCNRLLTTATEPASIFVDVENGDVRHELVQKLKDSDMHVLNKFSLGDVCGNTDDAIVVVRYNTSSSQTQGQEPWQCDNKNIRVYNIEIVGEDTQETRQRRALGGLDFYHLIADTSGGTVYETTKSNIAAVVDIIKESVTTKPPLTILKFKLLTTSNDSFEIPVDNLIQNLTIKIQGSTSSVPTMHLYRPSGTQETFSNASVSKQQILGTKLRVIHIYNPAPGIWRMERVSTSLIDVDVTGSTDLQFSYQFMQPGPGGYGDYPLIGRPIAAENMTIQVSVPLVDKVGSVDSILLVDRNGKVVANSTLRNVGGRRGKSLFKTHVVIPAKEFEVALEGKDKAGNVFRRLDPKIITALAIQLEVLPSSGTLYLKQSITIPYRVKNVGAGTATIIVSITDDKGFAQSPTSYTYTINSMASNKGSFTLKAGSIKGETTTVTISAKASGSSNNKVQYNVQRITVEEKIIRVIDTKAPSCNITSMKGKCDFGADICQCSKQTWEMKANVGDDGDGLLSVFSSGAGPKSTFKNDSFNIGHKLSSGVIHTTLSADCCHQQAKITVVDLAGNVGLCDVNITAGFVAPDPKLCIHPNSAKPVTTNANVTTISCNITNIVDTCNGNAFGNRKPCENTFWSAEAQLGNEGFGRIQVAAVNAGRHANLTKLNHTVKLSTDCCHPDVYINVVDVAGNTGQCHAQITASTNIPGTGASSGAGEAPPIGIIAGAAAGGVVVLGAIAGLVYYLKTRAGKIAADTNAVTPLS